MYALTRRPHWKGFLSVLSYIHFGTCLQSDCRHLHTSPPTVIRSVDCQSSLKCSPSKIVPFSAVHQFRRMHGGHWPSGSSPASFSSRATTPCAGTARAVKLRTTVPLSVCVQRSCVSIASLHIIRLSSRGKYAREQSTAAPL